MATQTRLLPQQFHLDARSREAGRRGLAKARAALADTRARTAETRRAEDERREASRPLEHHATAA